MAHAVEILEVTDDIRAAVQVSLHLNDAQRG
jgi:hypothetical protein